MQLDVHGFKIIVALRENIGGPDWGEPPKYVVVDAADKPLEEFDSLEGAIGCLKGLIYDPPIHGPMQVGGNS